jgi:hypothetical protein
VFFKGFWGIIGNQIKLWFFWKGSVLEVSGPGGAVAFTALQLSYVNMDDYDLQITRQSAFALITRHYVPLLCNTRQCMLSLAIHWHRVSPNARGSCWFLLTPMLSLQLWFLNMCDTIKMLLWILDTCVPHVHFASIIKISLVLVEWENIQWKPPLWCNHENPPKNILIHFQNMWNDAHP